MIAPHIINLDQRGRPARADATMSPARVRPWGSAPSVSLRDGPADRLAALPRGSLRWMVRAWARADSGAGRGGVGAARAGDRDSEV